MISRIRENQAFYDKDPEGYERRYREREEEQRQEREIEEQDQEGRG
jgi:hypothetical protein